MTADPAAAIAALRADPGMSPLYRSLEVYYGDPARARALDTFYAQFVRPGDVTFDIGSHVGDRIGSFRRLGAQVVAVEPQPLCARAIRAIYGGDDQVTVVEAACGAEPGTVTLRVNTANPTVSTASPRFIRAADGAPGWEHERWDEVIEVPVTTLDALIARHGVPAFAKIDVEGYEDQVLAGLSRPLPALSFEFTTIARDMAGRCLDRLERLGAYGFDLMVGESGRLALGRWSSVAEVAAYLTGLPHEANSGDVYAVSPGPVSPAERIQAG